MTGTVSFGLVAIPIKLYSTGESSQKVRFNMIHEKCGTGRYLLSVTTDHFRELTHEERNRIFNLGYFTWVEQQGISIEDFAARRKPGFWQDLRKLVPLWDASIEEFNRRVEGAGG